MDGPPVSPALARFEGWAMASPLRLALHGVDEDAAAAAWAAVREEFEACEQAMSRFRDSSEVTGLNRASAAGTPTRVGRRLRRALVAADRARRVTEGRFDARRLRDLDRLGYRGVPIETRTAGRTGWAPTDRGRGGKRDAGGHERGLELARDGSILLDAPVDLGGIGKGLALRWAAEVVRRSLPVGGGGLLEAGGDIVAIGPAPDGEAWLIGVDDPFTRGTPLAVVALLDAAVATSSIAVNRWRSPEGAVVHHLLDPSTGEPGGEGLVAVTIHDPDPAWAEVRTKQLFLAGRTGIADLARSLGLAAWWVADDGTLSMTPGARILTAWTAPPSA